MLANENVILGSCERSNDHITDRIATSIFRSERGGINCHSDGLAA